MDVLAHYLEIEWESRIRRAPRDGVDLPVEIDKAPTASCTSRFDLPGLRAVARPPLLGADRRRGASHLGSAWRAHAVAEDPRRAGARLVDPLNGMEQEGRAAPRRDASLVRHLRGRDRRTAQAYSRRRRAGARPGARPGLSRRLPRRSGMACRRPAGGCGGTGTVRLQPRASRGSRRLRPGGQTGGSSSIPRAKSGRRPPSCPPRSCGPAPTPSGPRCGVQEQERIPAASRSRAPTFRKTDTSAAWSSTVGV